jgi:hypothetical protein
MRPPQQESATDSLSLVSDPGTARLIEQAATSNIGTQRAENGDATVAAIKATIEACAAAFCGATTVTPIVLNECAIMMIQRYAYMGVSEITNAFSLAASKAITANLTTYYGVFPVSIFGEVLSAYSAYRDDIKRSANRAARQDAEYKAWQDNPKEIEKLDREFDARLKELAQHAISGAEILRGESVAHLLPKIMGFYYDNLQRRGLLSQGKEQQQGLAKRAKELTEEALKQERALAMGVDRDTVRKVTRMLENMEGEDFLQSARLMYKKLVVIDHLSKQK